MFFFDEVKPSGIDENENGLSTQQTIDFNDLSEFISEKYYSAAQIEKMYKMLGELLKKIVFMCGRFLYISVIGRPILIVMIFIVRYMYFLKLYFIYLFFKRRTNKEVEKDKKTILNEDVYILKEIEKFKEIILLCCTSDNFRSPLVFRTSGDFPILHSSTNENECFRYGEGEVKHHFTEIANKSEVSHSNKWNENMEEVFYKTKEYNEMMLEPNYLEQKWRKRVLITYTPRGNIIMYYDCYKRGFSYYSDQNNIPYQLLNAVAMKYVKYYLCIDLFMDNKIIKENINPMIKIREEEDREESKRKADKFLKNSYLKDKDLKKEEKKVFIKSKKYNLPPQSVENLSLSALHSSKSLNLSTPRPDKLKVDSVSGEPIKSKNNIFSPRRGSNEEWKNIRTATKENTSTNTNKSNVNEIYSVNTFIYLGKIQNYYILGSNELKTKKCNEKENKIEENMSYAEYKKKNFCQK
jgi:hypothetical protein